MPITKVDHFVSTSLSTNPQNGYNPVFDRNGIDTRNFRRKSDRYYKKTNPAQYKRKYVKTLGSSGRFSSFRSSNASNRQPVYCNANYQCSKILS